MPGWTPLCDGIGRYESSDLAIHDLARSPPRHIKSHKRLSGTRHFRDGQVQVGHWQVEVGIRTGPHDRNRDRNGKCNHPRALEGVLTGYLIRVIFQDIRPCLGLMEDLLFVWLRAFEEYE